MKYFLQLTIIFGIVYCAIVGRINCLIFENRFEMLLILFGQCADYVVTGRDMEFFKNCEKEDDEGNIALDEVFQSHLEMSYADDGEKYLANGNVTFKVPIPEGAIVKAHAEVYKWQRGQWTRTMFSLKRDNLCQAMFSPVEIWYGAIKSIPEEERICPPRSDTVYHLVNTTYQGEIPDLLISDLAGTYKIIAHVTLGEYIMCMSAVADVWRA
uniref:MD-2-related lipid-recognition domain-containing protein n=1 Tax=Glossina palpalis gambiensis TaxID=67801 RepID=A0A1B0BLH3_9MUSC